MWRDSMRARAWLLSNSASDMADEDSADVVHRLACARPSFVHD